MKMSLLFGGTTCERNEINSFEKQNVRPARRLIYWSEAGIFPESERSFNISEVDASKRKTSSFRISVMGSEGGFTASCGSGNEKERTSS